MTNRLLGVPAANFFESRKINAETAARYNVFTGRALSPHGEVVPDPNGNVLAFPFFDRGVEAMTKYRGRGKDFWQRPGGTRTFWNADVLDDPALHDGHQALIITEGEIDALSAIDCGFPFVVSVPDGAPAVPKGKRPDELDEENPKIEPGGKFEFIWNNRDRLKRVKRFILACDIDPAGQRLTAELLRRLSAAKCSFVTYPSESVVPISKDDASAGTRPCKDLNEVLMHFGPERVVKVLNTAQPFPVRGLYKLADYPEAQELETYRVGFDWGGAMKVFLGEFMVVTGIPSHGKTAWTVNLVANLVSMHGWRAAVCSPEMPTVPMLRDRLRRYYLGCKPVLDDPLVARADAWINDRFVFIDTDPTGVGSADEPFDLDWIIERATDAVLRDGIRVLVLDPWNEIDHARKGGETQAEYVGRGIRMLKRFAKLYGVVVIVVAHPTKEVGKDGKHRLVTLYDVDGAAHWYNKADHGVVVERIGDDTTVHIQKVRFEETGRRGKMPLRFIVDKARFESLDTAGAGLI